MIYPLVRELAADKIPVAVTCRVLKFSTQGYYAWCKKPVTDRDLSDAYLTNAAIDAHRDDPEFGYRLVADERREDGHRVGDRRIWRLCSQQGVYSTHSRKRGKAKRPAPPVHDDLVERHFTAEAPNQLWLTDIRNGTYASRRVTVPTGWPSAPQPRHHGSAAGTRHSISVRPGSASWPTATSQT